MWTTQLQVRETLYKSLNTLVYSSSLYAVQQKLKNVKIVPKVWNKAEFGNVFDRVRIVESEYNDARKFMEDNSDVEACKKVEELKKHMSWNC